MAILNTACQWRSLQKSIQIFNVLCVFTQQYRCYTWASLELCAAADPLKEHCRLTDRLTRHWQGKVRGQNIVWQQLRLLWLFPTQPRLNRVKSGCGNVCWQLNPAHRTYNFQTMTTFIDSCQLQENFRIQQEKTFQLDSIQIYKI